MVGEKLTSKTPAKPPVAALSSKSGPVRSSTICGAPRAAEPLQLPTASVDQKKGCQKADTGIKETSASHETEEHRLSYRGKCSKVDDRQLPEKGRKFINSEYFSTSQSKASFVLVNFL